jgi:hypothetical protein
MANSSLPVSKERSKGYRGVISVLVLAAFFLVSGLMGIQPDQSVVHAPSGQPDVGRVTGTPRWQDPSILSQVALGVGLLVLGVFRYYRLAHPRVNVFRPTRPAIKNAGAGKSTGALNVERNRLENGSRH